MGALCGRRPKGALQLALCLLALGAVCAGALLYSHLRHTTRSLEVQTARHRQQQEALSAQLQVVYEHRSRLERSLQKERVEHKKTKEDFLVYKLEAQESLNKEKRGPHHGLPLDVPVSFPQTQVAEFQQLIQALQKVPGLKDPGIPPQLSFRGQPQHPGVEQPLPVTQKVSRETFPPSHAPGVGGAKGSAAPPGSEGKAVIGRRAPAGVEPSRDLNTDVKKEGGVSEIQNRNMVAPVAASQLELRLRRAPASRATGNQRAELTGPKLKRQGVGQLESWNSIHMNSNLRQDQESIRTNHNPRFEHQQEAAANELEEAVPETTNEKKDEGGGREELDLEIDAAVEKGGLPQGQGVVAQEPMMPDDDGDAAEDPNDNGEDELEEAWPAHPLPGGEGPEQRARPPGQAPPSTAAGLGAHVQSTRGYPENVCTSPSPSPADQRFAHHPPDHVSVRRGAVGTRRACLKRRMRMRKSTDPWRCLCSEPPVSPTPHLSVPLTASARPSALKAPLPRSLRVGVSLLLRGPKRGFDVRSFGTGTHVKLPGPAPDKPNVYDFKTTYEQMYNDLVRKDKELYTQNGILHMLDRNKRIKARPERFQNCKDQFDLVITCEERVYDQVLEDLNSREQETFQPVHVINVDIQDNHEEATLGAFLICELCQCIQHTDDMENEMDELLQEFEEKSSRPFLHTVCFY
ncbi:SSU72 phosphatase, partial [Atractosteus spatula]|nr:SSU72 phosphatase [Atractosteus spatula]